MSTERNALQRSVTDELTPRDTMICSEPQRLHAVWLRVCVSSQNLLAGQSKYLGKQWCESLGA